MSDRQSELFSRTDIAISPDLVTAKVPPVPALTSAAAAESIRRSGQRETDQEAILDYLILRGALGATDEEILRDTGVGPNSVRARRGELVDCGAVVNAGTTRPTRSGRQAVVWRAKG